MLTPEQLTELEKLESQATKGEWLVTNIVDTETNEIHEMEIAADEDGPIICRIADEVPVDELKANQAFIAAIRNAAKELIAEVKEYRTLKVPGSQVGLGGVLHSINEFRREKNALEAKLEKARSALALLYEETAGYIQVNNLGDVHHNASMRIARNILKEIA